MSNTPLFLAWLLAMPFLGGALALLLPYRDGAWARRIAMMANGAALFILTAITMGWERDTPVRYLVEWVPQVGLNYSLWLDGVAMFWAWLVLGIGMLVLQYAGHYMKPDDNPRRFYAVMSLFIGAMLGVVISSNLLLMVVFWEMTSLTSFLLIGHWHWKKSAITGARRALLITGLGGLSLMCGVAVLYWILSAMPGTASLEWSSLWERRADIIAHPAAPYALLLMLVGAFTKSAQFPFHFWLPGAMEAPTPVSALLHAATMVKAGIYLLGRMYPLFSDMHLWIIVAVVGVLTVLAGGFFALLSHDLKQLLAWSTVSQLGLLTSFYGFGAQRLKTGDLLEYDLALVLSHALFKAALFMLIGVVDHGTHTRDWRLLGGLRKKMPWTAWLTVAGCASMAGLPFTFGFIAKKIWLGAGIDIHDSYRHLADILIWLSIIGSFFTMAYCLRLTILPFFGRPRSQEKIDHAHEGGIGMLFAPALLVTLCIAGGLYSPILKSFLTQTIQPDFYSTSSHYVVAIFKKLDLLTVVSLVTYFIAGPAIFLASFKLDTVNRKLGEPSPIRSFTDWLLGPALTGLATTTHKLVQAPSLRRNAAITLITTGFLTMIPLTAAFGFPANYDSHLWSHGLAIFLVSVVAASVVTVILAREVIFRLFALAAIGLALTGYFIVYEAPDLAITMILVELALLLMFLFLLMHIGGVSYTVPKPTERAGSAMVAVSCAALFAFLTFMASVSPEKTVPVSPGTATPSDYYLTHSKYAPEPGTHKGGGNNVVNVILVDFRGFDTLGEITVLAVAALGVAILFGVGMPPRYKGQVSRLLQKGAEADNYADVAGLAPFMKSRAEKGRALILRTTAPIVGLVALLFSIVLFFAGHNAPGGGFIGGLLAAAAVVPFLVGFRRGEDYPLRIDDPMKYIPVGLLLATGTGIAAMVLGAEFLHSAYVPLKLPLVGKLGLSSAALFDAGVFFLVVGITLLMVRLFGRRAA